MHRHTQQKMKYKLYHSAYRVRLTLTRPIQFWPLNLFHLAHSLSHTWIASSYIKWKKNTMNLNTNELLNGWLRLAQEKKKKEIPLNFGAVKPILLNKTDINTDTQKIIIMNQTRLDSFDSSTKCLVQMKFPKSEHVSTWWISLIS